MAMADSGPMVAWCQRTTGPMRMLMGLSLKGKSLTTSAVFDAVSAPPTYESYHLASMVVRVAKQTRPGMPARRTVNGDICCPTTICISGPMAATKIVALASECGIGVQVPRLLPILRTEEICNAA